MNSKKGLVFVVIVVIHDNSMVHGTMIHDHLRQKRSFSFFDNGSRSTFMTVFIVPSFSKFKKHLPPLVSEPEK